MINTSKYKRKSKLKSHYKIVKLFSNQTKPLKAKT